MFVSMQALFVQAAQDSDAVLYSADMKNGKRSPVGERISQARQTAGLSQSHLAEKLGVTQQMVGYLSGSRSPFARNCCCD